MGMFSDIDYSLIVLQLEKAMANGVATLNSSAKVPTNQISLTASDVGAIASTGNGVLTTLNAASGTISASVLPSYVDDVLNFANLAAFPVAGETGKIYVTEDTNKVYRWSGSVYVEISSSATAGEALKLTNARTISTTGDATYSISFDGSANVSSAITLANTGVTAGTYNALSTQVRPFTVDAKGRITGVSEAINITPPWSAITGTPTTLSGYGITNALPLSGGTVTGDLVSTSATTSTSTTTGAITAASLGVTGAIFANTVSANSYNLIPVGRGGGNVNTNTAVGVNAGFSNTTGNSNSFVGRDAGLSNTTGTNNSFVGRNAGYSNTTGTNNSFVGVNSGYSNTTGTNNSFVGLNAGFSNTTGNSNSFVGLQAGYSNTTGTNNSFVGVNAGYSNTTGNSNSFVGLQAGFSNTTGNSNSFVGLQAGYSNTTGNNNSFVGVNAGVYIADGVTGLTISNNSCFFGVNTKGTQNATNENVFCYNATGNGSNTVTIGDSNITNNFFRGALSLNGTQVISTRRTGWVAPTGTPTRTTFATSTVTLSQLAETVKALIDDLSTHHGLIGS